MPATTSKRNQVSHYGDVHKVSRRMLASRIATLSSAQQKEILHIVENFNVPYSKNTNGYFFNIDDVPAECLQAIQRFVAYSVDNKETLDAYDMQLQLCKTSRLSVGDAVLPRNKGRPCKEKEGKKSVHMVFDDSELIANIDKQNDHHRHMDAFIKYLYQKDNLGTSTVQTTRTSSVMSMKFVNAKKRFAKPPRNKEFDTDDITSLAIIND